jgi:hypothetical protein
MDNDLERAKNMKLLLCAFEQLSGLKINNHKVRCFVMERPEQDKPNINKFLGVI